MAATNPNYSKGREYQVNCQRCVIAYEMNRRGIPCEAKPKVLDGIDDVSRHWGELMEGQTWSLVGSQSRDETIRNIEAEMRSYGDGSRAVIYVTWKDGKSAHVFNVENANGRLTYVDAQVSIMVDIKDYISRSAPTMTRISRVDNLRPNPKYIDGTIKRK